jgi:CheY-like chemotaxis protein
MLRPLRLLLIEDNQDLAANAGEFLESRGHVVDYAADGLTGLHLAAVNSYDALVLDLGLPGLDGLALCKRLRDDARSSVPILMLTARDTERDVLACFAAGTDDYLTKPFSLQELPHSRRWFGATGDTSAGSAGCRRARHGLVARRGSRRPVLTPRAEAAGAPDGESSRSQPARPRGHRLGQGSAR